MDTMAQLSDPMGSAGALLRMAPAIERHGRDDDHAGHDLLHPVVETDLGAAVVDDRHDQRAEQRTEDRTFAAGE